MSVAPTDTFGKVAQDAIELADRILELAQDPLSRKDWEALCEEQTAINNRFCDLRDWFYGGEER